MVETIIQQAYRTIKSILVYQAPATPKRFVLDEHKPDDSLPKQDNKQPLLNQSGEFYALLREARRLADLQAKVQSALKDGDIERLRALSAETKLLEKRQSELEPIFLAYESGKPDPVKRLISASLAENELIIKAIYGLPTNKDIIIRRFEIKSEQEPCRAMLVYLEGMINKQILNNAVISPLMLCSQLATAASDRLLDIIADEYLPANQVERVAGFEEITAGINSGDTALFVDGSAAALIIDSKGYERRGVERPQNEQTVRGAQVAFSEGLRINTGLMRTFMQTSDLVTETFTVGRRVPQRCALMYLRSIANPTLVAEARRRLNGIATDYILNSGVLEQFIEDHASVPLPQTISTERPDRVAALLVDGRLAIFMEGVPFSTVFPVSFFDFFHSVEDWTLKPIIGNFMRLLRWVAMLLTIFLPSIYLAISYFHQEAMPTELILAVAAAREHVPFPAIVEIFLMELSFELIREAGWRVPGPLGSTIGIVGAIILGQAAVAANLVSPIMVVIIAITGLASFVIPEYRIATSIRLLRFVFILLAAALGLVGLAVGMLALVVMLCGMKSFGVPYMAPVGPKTSADFDVILRSKVFNNTRRPDALNPQDSTRQPPVSRRWEQETPTGEDSQ